jgi:chemotaxis protein MotB
MTKRKKPEPDGVPAWVVTYGDMMSLLLCFFILLAAFSELKKPDEFQKVLDAIQEAFGTTGGDSRIIDAITVASSDVVFPEGMRQRIGEKKSKSDNNESSTVGAEQTTSTLFDGRRWTIGKPMPFAAGDFELTDENKELLRELIAPRIHGSDKMFLVLGHAWGPDDRLGGLDFTDLAYQRARVVQSFLIDECDVDRTALSLWVAGATQPLKLGALAEQGGSNRRVEVFMTDTALADLHPDAAGTGRGG